MSCSISTTLSMSCKQGTQKMIDTVDSSLKDRKVAKCEKWNDRSRLDHSRVADALGRLDEAVRDLCAYRGIFFPALG